MKNNMTSFYIYGAGIVAASVYTVIKKLYNLTPTAFVVSEPEKNRMQIDGIPVVGLSEIDIRDPNVKYLIATPEMHHDVIATGLYEEGISKEQLVFVDNQLENQLMEKYYSGQQDIMTISELLNGGEWAAAKEAIIVETPEIVVVQAKCHVDKPLNKPLPLPAYIRAIQVGAALTNEVIAQIRDNIGEHISEKNRNYCELTATYYTWKNCQAQYKGLCHYRRIFDVSDEQLQALLAEHKDVDVILPYPTIHYPNINSQHERYVSENDWSAMLQAMKEVAPDYYEAYISDVSKQSYFYNFNMLIAKREVFDDYCQFLFSVLARTEELTTPKGWERADRFAGYLGENLTTLYFRKNRDKLKIVHAGKIWMT